MKIAIDAMGGDFAPLEIVKGVELARDRYQEIEFQLYGIAEQVKPLVKDWTRINLIPTTEVIEMGEEPVKAMRRKKDSSMVRAANAVKAGEADALFSAGNTGALLSSAIFLVGRIKGVDRPALATALPSFEGPHDQFVFMDLGANAENKPVHLYQYGILGSFYASHVLNIENARVRLLNNGAEEDKGDEVHKVAHQLMKNSHAFNFVGNIEARELLAGTADVVVADGFSGNAALKATEGTALTMLKQIKAAIMASGLSGKIGGALLKPAFKIIQKKLDYNEAGGAVILGVNASVVKTHGSAKANAVANTMGQIKIMIENNLVGDIQTFVADHADDLKAAKQALQNDENV
ncbi:MULTISPECIES: phosphate acyltransferase PlsX [Leuconostoc]|uniref:phosphate acyltransferase PlsX n=1 Tax=Leuconostoc TaxID=1243 RepID=UPI00027383F8|nr:MULTISPECIES: phosphate acyltransferase PlsX [Leuconostoc]KDA48455.1 Phosphate:acyl-ACP acyltransferase PlsX [Leuconostoc pseudomesenteroides 1159]KDA50626.1 Phosphate:acyl-ACP acyltransferase PlsX [Leuconostoc pseudomesenteroides PS12]OQJ69435.1 phosphate acyltransferase [Leuconostoc pseudomesenteroides]CCJ67314.1 Phosphate:acyl-ACP acyltransferase PlsX [Leuconostoc pseudomesenteroides 4882]MDG9744315.1 phosphate acyltransferase PlsX [Leuconostoc falkenbergense]